MARRTPVALVIAIVAFAAAPSSAAQGDGGRVRDGACFYRDTNFRGQSFCVEAGNEVDNVAPDVNDRISSIRVFGGAAVRVYKDSRFRGDSRRFDSDVRDLHGEGFDDAISSIRIERRSSGGGYRPSFGSQNPETIVRRAYQDILERDPDPVGMRVYRSHLIDDGWTEQQVREDLRRSPEYRERSTMTRTRAEEIVRQAYLRVLNREPDAGSQGYVDAVFRRKMTQQDVERELRNSSEFRGRNR